MHTCEGHLGERNDNMTLTKYGWIKNREGKSETGGGQ